MVFREKNLWDRAAVRQATEFGVYDAPRKKLFAGPLMHRRGKVFGAIRSVGEIRSCETTSLQARLVIKDDCVEIGDRKLAFRKTIDDGVAWEILIVFLARESLFTHGRPTFFPPPTF